MLIHNAEVTGSLNINNVPFNSGSFSGSFRGDGSQLSGVTGATTASYVEYSNVGNKPALVSGSEQITYSGLSGIPAGIVSGSSQVSFNGIVDKPTLVSGSSQVTYGGLSGIPAGIVSGSSQVTYSGLTGIPTGIVSSSAQVGGYGIFATTGSNQFDGSQAITGSLTVTGQVVAQTLNVQQVTSSIVFSSGSNIFGNSLSNTQQFTGSVSVTGSLAVAGALSSGTLTINGADNRINSGNELRFYRTDNAIYTRLYDDGNANGFVLDNRNGEGFSFQSAGTNQMRITSTGNLGLGVTPSAWGGGISSAIEGRNGSGIAFGFSNLPVVYFTSNAYFNGTDWIYNLSRNSAMYHLNNNNGSHAWFTAPSGTAGDTITFTQAMTLSADGRLLIGKTNDEGFALDVVGTGRFSGQLTASTTVGGTSAIFQNTGAQNANGIELRGGTDGTAVNWKIEKDNTVGNAFQLTPSTANGGTTYTTPVLTIASTGAATFSSSVTANTFVEIVGDLRFNSNSADRTIFFRGSAGSPDTNWKMGNYLNPTGATTVTLAATVIDVFGGAAGYGFMVRNTSNASLLEIAGNTGAATFSSSVTAGAFLTNGASGTAGQEAIRINNDNGYIGFFNSANNTRSGYIQANTTDVTIATSPSNPIIFATANAEKMRITSSGNVGIGTNNPDARLQINLLNAFSGTSIGASSITSAGNNVSIITTDAQNVNIGGLLSLGGMRNDDGTNPGIFGGIRGAKENNTSGNTSGYLSFYTLQAGVAFAERMRITSTGNVGIGTDSPVTQLSVIGQIVGGTTGFSSEMVGFTGLGSYNSSTEVENIDALYLRKGGTNDSSVSIALASAAGDNYFVGARIKHIRTGSNSNGHLAFETKSDSSTNTTTERMRITSDGYVRLTSSSGGIQFNGDTAAANALDDYEEGTFTPTFVGTNLTIITYGNRAAFYTKVGRLVTVTINIMTESLSVSGTHAVKIAGLPFTSNSTAESSNSVNVFNSSRWTALPPICGQVGPNSTEIELHSDRGATGAGTDPTTAKTTDMAIGSGNRNMVRLTATYFTA
jgi:hypothetical protein